MPSATSRKKRRHQEGVDDNTNGSSKRGQATDTEKIGASKSEDEDGGEEEGSDSQEEGPWRDVEVSSAALREACLVATPRPATSADTKGESPVDRCTAASAREKSRREKQQRRARALETLWKRLKVESKRGLKGKAVRPLVLPSSLQAPWLLEQPEAMALETVEGKGRGWFANQDLPPGTTLLASRPMVAHFENSADDDDDDDEEEGDDEEEDEDDEGSQESGNEDDSKDAEEGDENDNEEDGSEDDDNVDDNDDDSSEDEEGDDEEGDDEEGDDDPFMVDDATAALVVLLAESLLLDYDDQVAEAEAAGHSAPMREMVMDLFPRSVSEMPHPLPSPSSSSSSVQEKQQQHTQKKGSNSGQSLSLQHVDDGYTVWRCHDKALSELMRDALNNLAQSFQGNNNSSGSNSGKGSIGKKKQKNTRDGRKRTGLDLAARLPEIIRCNALSMDTASELLCFPDPSRGMGGLSGIGLYHAPSFFNHNCQPNVSRYSLGDLMVFRTNQPVPRGTELCISYLSHDLLAESDQVRQQALSDQRKGFHVTPRHDDDDDIDHGKSTAPPLGSPPPPQQDALRAVVTVELQAALMAMPARARLEELEYIQVSAGKQGSSSSSTGDSRNNDSNRGGADEEEASVSLLRSDEKELAVLKAITYAQIGEYAQAQASYEWALRWCHQHLPPNDEQIPMLAAQAAAANLALQQDNEANGFGSSSDAAAAALLAHGLAAHEVAFGGGAFWMGVRYQEELLEAPVLPVASARAWGLLTAATEDFRQYD